MKLIILVVVAVSLEVSCSLPFSKRIEAILKESVEKLAEEISGAVDVSRSVVLEPQGRAELKGNLWKYGKEYDEEINKILEGTIEATLKKWREQSDYYKSLMDETELIQESKKFHKGYADTDIKGSNSENMNTFLDNLNIHEAVKNLGARRETIPALEVLEALESIEKIQKHFEYYHPDL